MVEFLATEENSWITYCNTSIQPPNTKMLEIALQCFANWKRWWEKIDAIGWFSSFHDPTFFTYVKTCLNLKCRQFDYATMPKCSQNKCGIPQHSYDIQSSFIVLPMFKLQTSIPCVIGWPCLRRQGYCV
jgi:hypothetical protein